MKVLRIIRLAVLLTFVATSAAFSQTDTISQTSEKNEILEKWGIESTSEGITRYLKNMLPGSEAQKQIRVWIEQLDDRRFSIRRRAANSLIASPAVPQSLLEDVAESKVLEVRKRVKRYFETQRSHSQVDSDRRFSCNSQRENYDCRLGSF